GGGCKWDTAPGRAHRRDPCRDRRSGRGSSIAAIAPGTPSLDFYFLTERGQTSDVVAQRMASFLNGATASLDIALYDLRLEAGPGATLLGAFQAAVKRGVHVRLMFNQDHPADLPVPPPAEIDWAFVDQLKVAGIETKPIPGVPDLMHHKYVV